jgi:GntR family transcriptional regulator, transcriptional repressor for pyruvate dehydrogenase complex
MNRKTAPPGRARRAATAPAKPAVAATIQPAPLFGPVERAPAYTTVGSAIERKILARELREGEVLPGELELAQQFRVHRSTVREALRRLESAGLVKRPPGAKRMVVSRPAAAKVASGLHQALVLHDVSFVDVWEAMTIIEPEVAALAAVRRTPADLYALVKASETFRAWAVGDPGAVAGVADFFAIMGLAARNRVLVLAKQSLTQALAPSLARMIDAVPQARARIAEAQRKIIAALKDKDAEEARRWMLKHVRDFKRGYEVAGISPDTPISV